MNTPITKLPISAFAPISFTFRILERDFVGVAGPLFAAALLGHLDWLVLERVGTVAALVRSVKLTRGYASPIVLYGVILLMIGGMVQTLAPGAVLAALAAPGIVFLGLALRGELVR